MFKCISVSTKSVTFQVIHKEKNRRQSLSRGEAFQHFTVTCISNYMIFPVIHFIMIKYYLKKMRISSLSEHTQYCILKVNKHSVEEIKTSQAKCTPYFTVVYCILRYRDFSVSIYGEKYCKNTGFFLQCLSELVGHSESSCDSV